MSTISKRFSPEVRGRTVRMVGEHRADYASPGVALLSIAGKMGYNTEMRRLWCRELTIAPSSRRGHAERLADASKQSAWAQHDDMVRARIETAHAARFTWQ